MSANINSLLDKCEDPAKMIDEYMRQVTEQLAEVKKETAGVMAEETRTKRLLDENIENVNKYQALAEKAVVAGNDDDARTLLEKKQEYVALGEDLQKSYDIAKSNADKMRELHDKLTKDVLELEQRRKNVQSKVAVAKTQEKINKIAGSMDTASNSMKAFERMEAKADNMLDKANATAELNKEPVDPAKNLEEKYSSSKQNIEDELAALKEKLGK